MREPEHFKFFNTRVLPYLSATVVDKDLRIWSAGCSSGEEPYTLAMLLMDYFREQNWDTRVLATDISTKVLEAAVKGVYSNDKIEAIPNMWKVNYFKKVDGSKSIIDDKVKNNVIFRKLNLVESNFPFKRKFHVIFCRNVMIYFDNNTKDQLVNKFYDLTEPGGYLFIGHSESLNRGTTKYRFVAPAIYRKE
jgi:chemotaxis protein methyltransferase CheR